MRAGLGAGDAGAEAERGCTRACEGAVERSTLGASGSELGAAGHSGRGLWEMDCSDL